VTSPGELGDVRPGDFARVEIRKDGRVERIVDEFGSRNGRVVAIAGNQFVLDDGQVDFAWPHGGDLAQRKGRRLRRSATQR